MGTFRKSHCLFSASVIAAALASAPAAYAQATYQFDLPAQSLGTSLKAVGSKAGANIVFDARAVEGKTAPALRGSYTPEGAIRALLSGSGFTLQRTSGGSYVVAAPRAGQPVGNGVLVGSVRDHKTGGALKGALVEVVETGEKASTGDLGDFRFSRLPVGEVSLRISYLGFPEQVETVSVVGGLTNRADIYLGSGVTTEIVVIAGQASARAQALNQERTAENSTTVISSDLLGQFNGTTISDAMRRAPGISFQQNDLTGDGTNVIVRGLEPDYNQIRLNGVALLDGSGLGRSASLSTILADSVSEIKISKTLLPSQDSAGTGGLVEIETKSPLERPRRYASFGIEGLKRGKGYGEDYLASGTLSGRFGAEDRFGLSLSVQYRKQRNISASYDITNLINPGPYLPAGPAGQPLALFEIDPRTRFPFENGADGLYVSGVSNFFNRVDTQSLTGTLSAEWRASDSTSLKLDYVRARTDAETLRRVYTIFDDVGYYFTAPVPAEGGEVRMVLAPFDGFLRQLADATYVPSAKSVNDTLSLRGETVLGRTTINYRAGYASARNSVPVSYSSFFASGGIPLSPDILAPEAIDPATGAFVTYFGRRRDANFPLPLLNDAGFAALNSPANSLFSQANAQYGSVGRTRGFSGGFDIRREFGSRILQYLIVGGEYKRTRMSNVADGFDSYFSATGVGPDAATLGLEFEEVPYSRVSGSPAALQMATEASTRRFLNGLDALVDTGAAIKLASDPIVTGLFRDTFTRESDAALYAQARFEFGKVEIIGGPRFSQVNVDTAFLNSNTYIDAAGNYDEAYALASRAIVSAKGKQTDILPRVAMNWRPEENIVVRAGYYATVARPQIRLLAQSQTISLDLRPNAEPVLGQPLLSVTRGNPNLKPARSDNFDIGFEYYDDAVGVIKANVFYKSLANLLESERSGNLDSLEGIDLPDDPRFENLPSNLYVQVTRPVNNPYRATVWGIEAAVERRFTFLPGAFSGLGVYANYTYTKSSKDEPRSWFSRPVFDSDGNTVDYEQVDYVERNRPFYQSPKHSGTLGLTYSKYGFDGSLYYSFQGRRQSDYGDFDLDQFDESVDSLDARGEYRFALAGADARLTIEGRNLLKGAKDPTTERSIGGEGGVPKAITSGYYLGGRSFSVGLSVNF